MARSCASTAARRVVRRGVSSSRTWSIRRVGADGIGALQVPAKTTRGTSRSGKTTCPRHRAQRFCLGNAVRAKCLDDGLGKIRNPQDRDERLPELRLPAAWAGSARGGCARRAREPRTAAYSGPLGPRGIWVGPWQVSQQPDHRVGHDGIPSSAGASPAASRSSALDSAPRARCSRCRSASGVTPQTSAESE